LEQVPPEMENRKFSAGFISGDTFAIVALREPVAIKSLVF